MQLELNMCNHKYVQKLELQCGMTNSIVNPLESEHELQPEETLSEEAIKKLYI